jgi:hypothetical protein
MRSCSEIPKASGQWSLQRVEISGTAVQRRQTQRAETRHAEWRFALSNITHYYHAREHHGSAPAGHTLCLDALAVLPSGKVKKPSCGVAATPRLPAESQSAGTKHPAFQLVARAEPHISRSRMGSQPVTRFCSRPSTTVMSASPSCQFQTRQHLRRQCKPNRPNRFRPPDGRSRSNAPAASCEPQCTYKATRLSQQLGFTLHGPEWGPIQ